MNLSKSDNRNPSAEIINELIRLYQEGSITEVSNQIEKLLVDYQQSFVLFNLKGAASLSNGNFSDAAFEFQKAIELNSNNQNACNNLGIALQKQGRLLEAISSFERALEINPQYPEALNNLGYAYMQQGNISVAAEKLIMAINTKPDYIQPFSHLSTLLPFLTIIDGNPNLEKILLTILEEKYFDRPIKISRAVNSLLKSNQEIKSCLDLDSSNWSHKITTSRLTKFSNIHLLLKFMKLCPIVDLDLEFLLQKARKNILLNIFHLENEKKIFDFNLALAQQCFINEYVYSTCSQEEKALKSLEKVIEALLKENNQPSENQVACLACYKPLYSFKWYNLLEFSTSLEILKEQQISEPLRERKISENIKILGGEKNKVSSVVQKQYEENPYPRWIEMGKNIEKRGIPNDLSIPNESIFDNNSPNILIAGCGTGQHAIKTARSITNSDILAVDLSTSSLAYAQRKTQESGIKNIEYMKADILNLERLEKKFDIIECVGVLHHMDKPINGWRILKNCLKANGLMRVGLYSKVARSIIFEIRKEIVEKKIARVPSQMIKYRDQLINSDRAIDKSISGSEDFYSLSGFRDLLFNAQEHTFMISEIIEALDQLKLSFCGFELPNPKVKKDFLITFPSIEYLYNLNAWEEFERIHPDIFLGMYQFWCQKQD